MTDTEFLAARPALAAYLHRIGAQMRNFKKYVVLHDDNRPSYGGMRKVLATITVAADGTVTAPEGFTPEETEQTAIKTQWSATPVPRSIATTEAKLRELRANEGVGADATLFVFRHANADAPILFVQQRVVGRNEGERKSDLAWSFWDDSVWRMMEPEGPLPLFGLDQLAQQPRWVMVHEGAKSAAATQALLADKEKLAAHPWGNGLQDYAHIGWPGGAEHAARVDWTPLKRLPEGTDIVVVADNDRRGKEAVRTISRLLGRPMRAIMFTELFPVSFDLADKWPQHAHWWRGAHYRGPTLDELCEPATWATEQLPAVEGRRPQCGLLPAFKDEWCVVQVPAVIVNRRRPNRLYKDLDFNRAVAPYSDVPSQTARLLAQQAVEQPATLAYRPDEQTGIVTVDGERVLNTFRPSAIKPVVGDYARWLDFMERLFPVAEDRAHVLNWCATLIARPDIRMPYGLLLLSKMQGVGKSTLGEKILAPLVGMHNTSFPGAKEITQSIFNSWIAHKRLVVVHELYTGGNDKVYNALKSVVTDDKVTASRKHIEEYQLDNWIHIIACSNSENALYLDVNDRRWLVPKVTDAKQEHGYWRDLNEWLTGDGLSLIAGWAKQHVATLDNVIQSGMEAPMTSAKATVIANTRTPGITLVKDIADEVRDSCRPDEQRPVAVAEVRARLINVLGNNRLEAPRTVRDALIEAGFHAVESRHRVPGIPGMTEVVSKLPIPAGTPWGNIQGFYRPLPPLPTLPM